MGKEEVVYIGADHAGFKIKDKIKKVLEKNQFFCEDLTPIFKEGDDYPNIAFELGEKVVKNNARGILICGSGVGMVIAANKVKGVRAVEGYNKLSAKLSREDNDSNVLVLGAWTIRPENIEGIVNKWLQTRFSNIERHKRRLKKIEEYER